VLKRVYGCKVTKVRADEKEMGGDKSEKGPILSL